ncbi:DNA polymerase IV [Opitutaceae bacterium EW11]|nr:DNA polymerase IV [Opitutaceae bacterium EW11]
MLRTIVHLDADAFFVSVEQARNPALRGKKVAVGGRQRGIISSASYEARACGVYTPMPTSRALKVCPDLILVSHTSGLYGEYSRRLFALCEQLTPLVQRSSIDEGYLDVTPCGFKSLGDVETAVRKLQMRITDELGITVSFGIASNKLVAAIASKLKKPRGFVVVPHGGEAGFLAPLSIGKLPGIGEKTEKYLNAHGIKIVSDLFERTESELSSLLGSGWRELLESARGVDHREVETDEADAKSYSQQETFGRDIADRAEIERVAKRMLEELMRKVRNDRKRVRTLTIRVRYPDFSQASAAHTVPESSELETAFYAWIAPTLDAAWKKRRPLRLVSVRLSGVDDAPEQLQLFSETSDKRKRLAAAVDALKQKGGEGIVVHGSQIAAASSSAAGARKLGVKRGDGDPGRRDKSEFGRE